MPVTLLTYVYGIIARPLEDAPTSKVAFEIIEHSSNIFNLFLPGANVLIPYYLHAIKQLADGYATLQLPTKVRHNMIAITASLICFPNFFRDLTIPVKLKVNFRSQQSDSIRFLELKEVISQLLKQMLAHEDDKEHKAMLLYANCVLILEELHNASAPNASLVNQALNDILVHTKHEERTVNNAALDSITTLAAVYDKWNALNGLDSVQLVVLYLANNIIEHSTRPQLDLVMEQTFDSLRDWLLLTPPTLLDDPKLRKRVFTAAEVGLCGEEIESKDSNENRTERAAKLLSKPSHGMPKMQEAAERFLLQVLNNYSQFPSPAGPAAMNSTMDELDDTSETEKDVIYWKMNGEYVISTVPLSLNNEPVVRLFVRNKTGLYSWEATSQYDDFSDKTPLPIRHTSEDRPSVVDSKPSQHSSSSNWDPQNLPEWKEDGGFIDEDRVDHLLKHLSHVHQENFATNDISDKTFSEQCGKVQEALEKQAKVTASEQSSKVAVASLATPEVALNPFHYCRLFLSQLNICDYDHRDLYKLLERGKAVSRTISSRLDEKFGRYVAKIGVAYVKKGQDTIIRMLENDVRSQHYQQFIQSLGWEVNYQVKPFWGAFKNNFQHNHFS